MTKRNVRNNRKNKINRNYKNMDRRIQELEQRLDRGGAGSDTHQGRLVRSGPPHQGGDATASPRWVQPQGGWAPWLYLTLKVLDWIAEPMLRHGS